MKTIRVELSPRSIDKAIKELQDYSKWLETKCRELCERLAQIGLEVAVTNLSNAVTTGTEDFDVTVEPYENGYRILADGESVLFLEFGAGITYGYGHPLDSDFGMGPGTYPPTNPDHPRWNDPKGWWIPGGQHTYGNPPGMGMYLASKEMRNQIEAVAREVFRH